MTQYFSEKIPTMRCQHKVDLEGFEFTYSATGLTPYQLSYRVNWGEPDVIILAYLSTHNRLLCLTIHLDSPFESEILSSEPLNFTTKLGEWLPQARDWSVCWRATRDGWAGRTFHARCDGKVPTLTMVKVVKDNKKLIFGGFATTTWAGDGEFEFIIAMHAVGCIKER
jgi:hypothetical protein